MTDFDIVRCPACGHVSRPCGGRLYFCAQCRMQHDDDPEEGGVALYNDPEKAAISKEEYAERQRLRAQRRRMGRRKQGLEGKP